MRVTHTGKNTQLASSPLRFSTSLSSIISTILIAATILIATTISEDVLKQHSKEMQDMQDSHDKHAYPEFKASIFLAED